MAQKGKVIFSLSSELFRITKHGVHCHRNLSPVTKVCNKIRVVTFSYQSSP